MKQKLGIIASILLITFGAASNVTSQWVRTNMLPNSTQNPYAFSFAVGGKNIYAGCDSGRIFRSSDNGKSWTLANSGTSGFNFWALAAKDDIVFAGSNFGFFISTNNATSWQTASNLSLAHTLIFKGDSLFACTESDGFFLSTDNGKNWIQHFSGNRIYGFIFQGQREFAGNFLTIDSGKSWVESNQGMGLDEVYSLIERDGNIFAGAHSGVYIWDNIDSKWSLTSLSGTGYVLSFAAIGTNLFASTLEEGIFLSTDNGQNWMTINPNQNTYWEVYAITIKDNIIFAATYDGVWRRSLSDFGISDVKIQPSSDTNISLSPNPTTGIIVIHNAPANIMHVTITNIFDKMVSEIAKPGTAEFTIDLSKLPTGMYNAKFVLADEVIMRKIIKE